MFHCALVAVTTATDVGVAMPSTGAGAGGVTGGLFPEGGSGAAEEDPPPQPEVRTTNAMSNIAMNSSRVCRANTETFGMSSILRERIGRRERNEWAQAPAAAASAPD
jgi:hypothetical protein